MRRAVFDLYRRHRVAQDPTDVDWEISWDQGENGRLRAVGVDFVTRHVFLVTDSVSSPGVVRRFEFTPDDLARGIDHATPMLTDHVRGEDLKAAQSWIFRHWHTMTRHAVIAVSSSLVALYARLGSTVADFARVPPDAFAHYEVTDWLKGVIESPHGPPLLSPHLDLDSAGPFINQPSATGPNYVAQQHARSGRRPSPILDFTKVYIRRTFPGGVPPGLGHKQLAREVSEAHFERFGRPRIISDETVRKAILALRTTDGD